MLFLWGWGVIGMAVKVETRLARNPGSPCAWVGVGLGSRVGRLVRWVASFIPHDLGTAGSKKAQLICPGRPASPKSSSRTSQAKRGRSWLPVPSGWASVGLEPVPIFLTRLLGHLGQL